MYLGNLFLVDQYLVCSKVSFEVNYISAGQILGNLDSTLEKLCNLGNTEHLSRGQTNWSNENLEHDVYWVLGLGSFEAQQLRLSHGMLTNLGSLL